MEVLKETNSCLSHLQCAMCDKALSPYEIQAYAQCDHCTGTPLISVYDIRTVRRSHIDLNERSMWRYFPLLPVFDHSNVVSLGEGWTPLFMLRKAGNLIGLPNLWCKDESFNPTGSFKARGMSVAISKAKELGIERCIVPTAGNAGGAMSAYCAKAGMEAVVVMPSHTPKAFVKECTLFGARVTFADGLISDCARRVREINSKGDYFDLSTLKEPYRLEGKKTMGYEIAEQMQWKLPDVILYPTGGGTGLIGIWKAFHEMMDMNWISGSLSRLIAVQSAECQPIVETWIGNQPDAKHYKGRATFANGLAVPQPFGEAMVLKALHESNGFPCSVTDEQIFAASDELAKEEGLLWAPEGAALWAALKALVTAKQIHESESVLLLNTGSAYKYLDRS